MELKVSAGAGSAGVPPARDARSAIVPLSDVAGEDACAPSREQLQKCTEVAGDERSAIAPLSDAAGEDACAPSKEQLQKCSEVANEDRKLDRAF